jgi:hypothetical protein
LELRLGPFDLHPRLAAGLTYDDNILLATVNRKADAIWMIQPGLRAVAGDDAALIAYRDQHQYSDDFGFSPGDIIFQQPEERPGKLLILDYSPGFQIFDKYTANNFIDQSGTFNLLWPMDKLILEIRQDYQLEKTGLIWADQRAKVETISSVLSAAYQFDAKTSMESNFRRLGVGYYQPGLIGYTEYNTEDWFNYEMAENLPVSLGVLAGLDDVANHQDQTYEQLRARARYLYTQKLTFDISAGGELRQYGDKRSETLSPVFTVVGKYHAAERTLLILTGYRQQYAAIYNGYNYSSTGAKLDVWQGITDRFDAIISAGYYSIGYTPINSTLEKYTGNYYVARISLEAKIIHHLTGQVFYQLQSSRTQVSGDMNDNQTGFQLTLSF